MEMPAQTYTNKKQEFLKAVFYLLHYLSSKSTASQNLSAQELKNSCM